MPPLDEELLSDSADVVELPGAVVVGPAVVADVAVAEVEVEVEVAVLVEVPPWVPVLLWVLELEEVAPVLADDVSSLDASSPQPSTAAARATINLPADDHRTERAYQGRVTGPAAI